MTYSPVTAERRVSAAIVDVLAEAGVRHVLGMPGGYTGTIFSALYEHPTIRVVQCREESIGSIAAEAYGRITGGPVVIMGQGEWIVGNAGQGALEAMLGCSPVLVLTEMSDNGAFAHHGPYQAGTGDYGAWDTEQALRGVSKRVMVARYPGQTVQHTQLAIKHALTGEPGPVAVIYHSESLRGRVGEKTEPRLYPTSGYLPRPSLAFDAEAVSRAATALRAAERPVIVAGNGVRVGQAYDSLLRLARAIDAPVATTSSGKGVIVETDPLALGVMGTFGNAGAIEGVHEADVVLAVGTKLGPSDTGNQDTRLLNPAQQTLIHIDVEPLNVGWTFPVDHALIGEANVIMDRLTDAFGEPASHGAAERVTAHRSRYDDSGSAEAQSDEVPFMPQRVVTTLQEVVPSDVIITCDAGENRLFMMHWFKTVSPGGYLQPAAGGGMGYAVPAAIGAKLARPDQPVIAVCGDGSFAMSLHALMTAVQQKIAIGVVVFNNAALGWVVHGMGERAVAATFDDWDHAAIAKSLGCDAVRPSSIEELRDALKQSAAPTDRPFLVDVPTSLATSFKDIDQFNRLPK